MTRSLLDPDEHPGKTGRFFSMPEDIRLRILAALGDFDEFVLLESLRSSPEDRQSLLFFRPHQWLECPPGGDARAFLKKLDSLVEEGMYWAGWFSYEFAYLLDPVLEKLRGGPGSGIPARIGVFDRPARFDHGSGRFSGDWPLSGKEPGEPGLFELREGISREDFFSALAEIREQILAGETYQVNFTFPLEFSTRGDSAGLYRSLSDNQPVSHAAWIREGGREIMSFSPELFFRLEKGMITTRPMKGTIGRGKNRREDRALAEALREDSKSRSENLMIVDLLRNDVARLLFRLGGGRVRVDSLFAVETYETLQQMTSTISGRLHEGEIPFSEAMCALFPCGSVTGAPKLRAMEIIAALEARPRGVYCGAIGHGGPGGACLNVPIRSLTMKSGRGVLPVGAGIIHDSEASAEWEECLLKGDFLLRSRPEFSLVETLLLRPGEGYVLLREHLLRLEDSCAYFGFPFSRDEVETRLAEKARECSSRPMRIRVSLDRKGKIEITAGSHSGASFDRKAKARIGLASERTDPEDVFLYHKTTHRPLYDHYRHRAGEVGLFDILFANTRGEITEGTITNFFFEEDGVLFTPPLACGLLPGTLRELLLLSRRVRERVLLLDEIDRPRRLFLGNSVRGLVPVGIPDPARRY